MTDKEATLLSISSCGLSLTQAAILAYEAKQNRNGNYQTFSGEPTLYQKDHTEMYVFPLKNGKVIISFQGSQGKKDWCDNLKFFLVKEAPFYETNIKVSFGFYSNYSALSDTLINLVHQYGVNKIILVGHSLGAANARLARFEIKSIFGVEVPTILFGEPNGGNKAYYKACGMTNVWSIKNRRDIVCKVPFTFLGYYSPERIKVDGHTVPIEPVSFRKWLLPIGDANDHYMQRYIEGCIKFESCS